jgi:mannitol/fructose-specific phosphotransferase system IIA component (Ntr-type)
MKKFGIDIIENQICFLPEGQSKHEALGELVRATAQNPAVTDVETFERAVFDRESVMSTGIGDGIAIPHVRIPEITSPTLGVGISKTGVDFDALDNKPVHIMVLFATPEGSDKEYLGLLAQVMLSLRNREIFERLLACETAAAVCELLNG